MEYFEDLDEPANAEGGGKMPFPDAHHYSAPPPNTAYNRT